jgi:PAS domain S-box-containing protein
MPAFRDLPIKKKLVAIIMVTSGTALLLSGISIVGLDSILFRGYLERDISALARLVADNSTAALSFEDPDAASETLAALRARTHIVSACTYRADGTLLAHYYRGSAAAVCPPPAPADEIRFSRHDLTASRSIVLTGRRVGTLVLVYDLGEIAERRNLYGGMVLGILLASAVIVFFVSSRLRATIATPVSQLASATVSVSRTRDYSIRASKFANDELGVLVDAFNEMLSSIESRDDELKSVLISREVALREAQNARDSLETTLASIGDAVISTDIEGRIVFANREARSLLGWPESELKGRKLDEVFNIVNEHTRVQVESPVARVLRDGSIVTMASQTILIARDGDEIPIDVGGAPIRREGAPIQGTVLVFRDVTARRHAEETSRLLASIVQSSGDAIIAKDLNGIVTSWNPGAESVFGYTAAEMIGRSISVIAAPGREDEMPRILERIRHGEKIDNFHTMRRRNDGRIIHVALTISPVYDALGRVAGASKIARDITEQEQAAARLAQLNAELQQSNEDLARSNEDLERFAFVASHDLQEPLRMITVYSQLLVKTYAASLDSQGEVFVDNIVGGTQRMRELLADLLAYTEFGARVELPVEPVDLNGVLQMVLDNLKVAIADTHATINVSQLPTLRAHQAHLIPLFQNLISNAIKYRGAAPPVIDVSVAGTGPDMQFAVTDNGIGIEPEYREKIFIPFKRLHGKTIPGTGIGLAICQRVVERYGGSIRVESEPGRGSTFLFTLPGAFCPEPARSVHAQVRGSEEGME